MLMVYSSDGQLQYKVISDTKLFCTLCHYIVLGWFGWSKSFV